MSAFHWRSRRKTLTVVRMMLLLWAFGIAAGGVNACPLQPTSEQFGLAGSKAPTAGPGPSAMHGGMHDAADASEDCQRFCEASVSAIPKGKVAALDAPTASAPFAVALRLPPAAAQASDRGRRPGPPPPPEAPVPIRFLRLTI